MHKKKEKLKTVEAGTQLPSWNDAHLYLIADGILEVRVGDSKILDFAWKDELVLVDGHASLPLNNRLYCKSIVQSSYYEIAIESLQHEASAEITRCLYEYASWRSNHLCNRWLSLCTNDAYHEVKYAIEWLMQLPEEVRKQLSLIGFIINTSRVSRSHALSIIKALKTGNYIEIRCGCITKILKALPERY